MPGQEATRHPLYTVDLSPLIAKELDIGRTGTLTFLTDHTLAVSICRNGHCSLETLDLSGSKPKTIASTAGDFQHYSALFRASEGRFVLHSGRKYDGGRNRETQGAFLLDSDLHESLFIPNASISQSYISTTGATFVKQSGNEWEVYKMGPPPHLIRTGTGSVLSVSDDAVAYIDQTKVRIEGLDGKALWSYSAVSNSIPLVRSIPMIRFLGRDHLWFENGSQVEILDLNGKPLQRFDKPDGFGPRIRTVLRRKSTAIGPLHAAHSINSKDRRGGDRRSHDGHGSRRTGTQWRDGARDRHKKRKTVL